MRRLKNGSEVPAPIVVTTMMNLELLMTKNPIAFYELVQKCRNNAHEMFGNTKEVAASLALMDSAGSVHNTVKDVVLSAVQGDDLDMRLENPVAPLAEAVPVQPASASTDDTAEQASRTQPRALVRFYIERPADRFGNTGYPAAIISAEEVKRDAMFGPQLKLIAPESMAKSWPTVSGRSFVELPDNFGPARKLTHQEHQAIWQQYLALSGPQVAEREAVALKNSPFNY